MSPTVITLIFLAFAIIMFVTEKIPLGLTSMIVCVGLVITGVLSVSDAFNGFINSNVILFVAMFIVGGALFETGTQSDYRNHGDCGSYERISFQHRYGSSSYSGCNWNCSEVRV